MPDSFTIVYFFVPLDSPIDLPNKAVIPLTEPFDPAEHYLNIVSVDSGLQGVTSSIVSHQISGHKLMVLVDASIKAARNAFPTTRGQLHNSHTDPPELPITTTVLEIAVPLHSQDQDSLSDSFDKAIGHIQDIEKAYSLATGHMIPLTSMWNLPAVIPYTVRTVEQKESVPTWPTDINLFMVNPLHADIASSTFDSDGTSTQSVDALLSIYSTIIGGPLEAPMEAWREAQLAMSSGQHTVVCILTSTFCELFLRSVLTQLMWEEGLSPRRAAEELCGVDRYARPVKTLIGGQIAPRLGGNWNLVGRGAVAQTFSKVFAVRNRILHGGYIPQRDESEAAIDASGRLFEFLSDRLTARIMEYPATAMLLFGQSGIDQRGLTKRLDNALEEGLYPLDPTSLMYSYQFEVERYVSDLSLRTGGSYSGSIEGSHQGLLIYPNGIEIWVILDPINKLLCRSSVPQLRRRVKRNLNVLRSDIGNTSIEMPHAIRLTGVAPVALEDVPKWYPLCDVWPLQRADRYESWPIPF